MRLNLNLLAAAYAATNLALGVQMALAPQLQQFMFVALAAGAAGLEALVLWEQKPVIRKSFLAAALVIFAAGAVLWALDAQGLLCDPRNPIRWQAVWHALTAVAASFLYAYYLSENTG